jgi:hypothetical protein
MIDSSDYCEFMGGPLDGLLILTKVVAGEEYAIPMGVTITTEVVDGEVAPYQGIPLPSSWGMHRYQLRGYHFIYEGVS